MTEEEKQGPPTAAIRYKLPGSIRGWQYTTDPEFGSELKHSEREELITRSDHEQDKEEALKRQQQEFLELIDQRLEMIEDREKEAEPNMDNILAWRKHELQELREELEATPDNPKTLGEEVENQQ